MVNNDAVSWRVLARWDFDAIVLSPGPGTPGRWHDFGVCRDILRYSEIPVLGICLGHQGLGNLLDGDVEQRARGDARPAQPRRHDGNGLFEGIPQDFSVVRYHSLAITGPLGPRRQRHRLGRRRRRDGDRTPQPADVGRPVPPRVDRHRARRARSPRTSTRWPRLRSKPRAGAARRRGRAAPSARRGPRAPRRGEAPMRAAAARRSRARRSTEALFERLFGDAEHAFWLDSADAPTRLAQCSYLGTSAGARPLRARVRRRRRRGRGPARRAATTRRARARSSTCSTASSPSTRSSRRRELGARPDRRLRRLPRLRAARPTAARPTCTAPTCPTR